MTLFSVLQMFIHLTVMCCSVKNPSAEGGDEEELDRHEFSFPSRNGLDT